MWEKLLRDEFPNGWRASAVNVEFAFKVSCNKEFESLNLTKGDF